MKLKPFVNNLAILPLTVSTAFADQAGINAGKGFMIAGIVNEKCTGNVIGVNEMGLHVDVLLKAGFAFEDIRRGFAEGTVYAESTYPGNTRPPRAECAQAAKLVKAARAVIGR